MTSESLPLSSPLSPGFKLDRYELLFPIAEGGMASVWIARLAGKHGFEKLVAIKTVLPKFASDEVFQQMFIDEARIASRIEHVNVAQILDVGEQHGITYLVMEYVDGEALSRLTKALQKKGVRVPPGVLLRVMADVCGGLHAAHELRGGDGQLLGVVHRDVSPQNVLISRKGVAKLIDFGIAKARDRVGEDTSSGQFKGKIRYMAPEQALGKPTDRRSDIWSAGAVLHHILVGKPPFEGASDVDTIFKLASGLPAPPLPPSVHPAVAAVVARALTHAPDKRYATAFEMQQAIERAMVEAGLVTNASDVEAFLAEHSAERADKRKEALALALKAAAEREKFAELMRKNADNTSSISDGGTRAERALATPPPASGASGATLSSASVELPPPRRSRATTLAFAAGIAGVVFGIGGVGLYMHSRSSSTADPSPGASRASSAATAPALPPSPAMASAVSTASASASASAIPAAAPPPPATPRPVVAPRPRPTVKRRINDGF